MTHAHTSARPTGSYCCVVCGGQFCAHSHQLHLSVCLAGRPEVAIKQTLASTTA